MSFVGHKRRADANGKQEGRTPYYMECFFRDAPREGENRKGRIEA
jgi:hypothetical protein